MKRENWIYCILPIFLFLLANILISPVFAKQTKPQDRIATFKAFMDTNKKALSKYEWIETTTVTLKNKEKFHEQMRCYYGADGKLQKLPIGDSGQDSDKGGRPIRRIINKMKDDKARKLKEYMEQVEDVIGEYFPIDPAKIRAAKDMGKASFDIKKPENTGTLTINDYLKSGDSVTFVINLKNNRPISAKLSSFLDSNKDPVNMAATFSSLNDGTSYVSKTVLDATKKELKITIENSGYRKMSQ